MDFGYVFCNNRLFWGISLYAGCWATAGIDVNVRMWTMNNAIGIAMLAFLSCLPMPITIASV
ncbi:hypothetical protein APA_988 [Pseudanabaena sp. lw0831]|nr:hypothetical protein APA_988 [Pseudanabaena sp. lw0831]